MDACSPNPTPRCAARSPPTCATPGFTAEALRGAWGDAADDAIARGLRSPAARALGARGDAARRARPALRARDAAARVVGDFGAPAHRRRRARAARARRQRWTATCMPLALIRPQSFADARGARASGGSRATSTRPRSAVPLPEDHVLGVGGASLTLAALQLPTPAAPRRSTSAPDAASRRCVRGATSTHVVATDISARALRFTRLNALLNGVDGIETRLGSLFDPVAGEQFDRIVSNPPFVITPRVEGVPAYEYRDGGMAGDDLVAAVRAGVGAHLAPGGVAQLLGNWESHAASVRDSTACAGWVEASPVPLDAWVVERETLDPLLVRRAVGARRRHARRHPGVRGPRRRVARRLRRAGVSPRSASATCCCAVRPAGAPTLARYESLPHGARRRRPRVAPRRRARRSRPARRPRRRRRSRHPSSSSPPTSPRRAITCPAQEDPTRDRAAAGRRVRPRADASIPGSPRSSARATATCRSGCWSTRSPQLLEVDAAALRADLLPARAGAVFTGFLALRR